LQANLLQDVVVLAPLGLHADVKVEEDAGAEEPFEVLSSGGADPLDHLAATAQHDGLLRLTIDHDRAIELEEAPRALRLLEAIHHHCARKRDLRMRELQQLLAHDL